METNKISNNMLERVPLYLNYIKSLPKDVKNISATKIANALGFGEVLVRKDLAKISEEGRCKLGYPCEKLIGDIEEFLDIKSKMDAVLVGNGNLLQVMLEYEDFEKSGLNLIAAVDVNCSKRYSCGDKIIYPLKKIEDLFEEKPVSIAVLMNMDKNEQKVCDKLISLGVNAIWNLTSAYLAVPEDVIVQNESITASITKLRLNLKERRDVI